MALGCSLSPGLLHVSLLLRSVGQPTEHAHGTFSHGNGRDARGQVETHRDTY